MKTALSLLMCLVVATAPACSILTPQQKSQTRMVLDDELAAGNITQAQHDAAVEALDKDQPFDWTGLGIAGANLALALLGAPLIVRKMRGPPTQKVGLPQDKIIVTAPPPA